MKGYKKLLQNTKLIHFTLTHLHTHKKGQSISEYLILIGIVIAAVVAMQTYARRSLQSVIKVAADDIAAKNAMFAKDEDMYTQTITGFSGSCNAPGECSSVSGTETTTDGIPLSDLAALNARGINVGSIHPIPLTQAVDPNAPPPEWQDGKIFYYAAPTTTTSSENRIVLNEERKGGERHREIIKDYSDSVLVGTSQTIYYEKEQ